MRALLLATCAIVLAACSISAGAHDGETANAEGSGNSRTFDVAGFHSVSLGGFHNVVVRVGPAVSVRAEGPSEELDRLDIRVKDGDLRIATKRDSDWPKLQHRTPVTLYVTTPSLDAASIGGSGNMTIDRIEGARFRAAIGGSGDMKVDALKVGEAEFSIAGSGGIRAAGSAGKQNISIAGSGSVDVGALDSRTASVSVMGSGGVQARATETADVNVMGSGDVSLAGGAKCSVHKMGSGNVHCA